MKKPIIKPLCQSHYKQWCELYKGYGTYYEVVLEEDNLNITWQWLMNAEHPCTGLIALLDDKIIGLAHFRAMPSPLRGENIGFLDDLFVCPSHRGLGVAEALIACVKEEAIKQKWTMVRWITRENNHRAKSLYNKLAQESTWRVYEMSQPLNIK